MATPTTIEAPAYQSTKLNNSGVDLTKMTGDLKGNLRSSADIGANQQIGNISRGLGGQTASPAFQLLSTMARTGARAQAGATGAQLDYNSAKDMNTEKLQRDLASQQAAQQANSLALQSTLGIGNLNLARDTATNQQTNAQAQLDLQRKQLVTNAIAQTGWGGKLDSQMATTALKTLGVTPTTLQNNPGNQFVAMGGGSPLIQPSIYR